MSGLSPHTMRGTWIGILIILLCRQSPSTVLNLYSLLMFYWWTKNLNYHSILARMVAKPSAVYPLGGLYVAWSQGCLTDKTLIVRPANKPTKESDDLYRSRGSTVRISEHISQQALDNCSKWMNDVAQVHYLKPAKSFFNSISLLFELSLPRIHVDNCFIEMRLSLKYVCSNQMTPPLRWHLL